ncbi:Ig-like domain-containing protein [Myroides sp. JBRI-B21084]|uniref:tandem-95 repeat protein n=1 Tax=Myroides sp. JBRI-B21084 TaxID=3119977 RepID=UPI0026E1AB0C|nr:Ig-like domain-containing protein [Paenimyroides cloacae]WKW45959.1 Ig-like domain-containing protein [Paenimyroides cloacae]
MDFTNCIFKSKFKIQTCALADYWHTYGGGGGNTASYTATFPSVKVPLSSSANAVVGVSGLWGNRNSYYTSYPVGDLVSFGKTGTSLTNLIDPLENIATDVMNSSIAFTSNNNVSADGGPAMSGNYLARNPAQGYTDFYDSDILNANGILPTTASPISVDLRLTSTSNDILYAGSLFVSVDIEGAVLKKTISPTTIIDGNTATYTFTITNPSTTGQTFSGLAFTDLLPSGIIIAASPNITITGGSPSVTATAGSNVITVSNLTLAAGQSSVITVNVTNVPGMVNISCSEYNEGFSNGFDNINTSASTSNLIVDITPQACLQVLCKPNSMQPLCDYDSDGVANNADIDNDNDGILNAVESPNCFLTSTQASVIKKVSTPLASTVNNIAVVSGADIPTMHNGTTGSSTSQNHNITAGSIKTDAVLYNVAYPTEVLLTSMSVYSSGSWGTLSSAVLYGSNDNNTWVLLSPNVDTSTNSSPKVFTNQNHPTTSYKYYQIKFKTTGSSPAVSVYEVSAILNLTNYNQSLHYNYDTNCNDDFDLDTIPNFLDLDSDNDGCPDALEGSATITLSQLITSTLPGGNSGALIGAYNQPVTTNLCFTTACVNTQGLPQLANPANYNNTTGQAIGTTLNTAVIDTNCNFPCDPASPSFVDSDKDTIGDECDLDDDNDGILDTVECGSLFTIENSGTFGSNTGWFVRNLQSTPGTGYTFASFLDPNYADGNNIGAGGYLVMNANVDNAHNFFDGIVGHTDGTAEDMFLAVNGSNNTGIFFNSTFYLAANTNYNFGFWALNANPNPLEAPTYPVNLGYRVIKISDNSIVASGSTGSISTSQTWTNSSGTFTTGSLTEQYRFEIYNISTGGTGNDFAIDDIYFKGCGDTDGDSIPNYLDVDSDNDGCPDAVEGDATITYSQLNSNGSINGTVNTTVGSANYGVPTIVGLGQGSGSSYDASTSVCCNTTETGSSDNDNDGVIDSCDLDNDNDGILDTSEGCRDTTFAGDNVNPTGLPNVALITQPFSVSTFTPSPANMAPIVVPSSITSTTIGSGINYVHISSLDANNNPTGHLEFTGITATTLEEAKTNNEYIEFSFTSVATPFNGYVDWIGYYNRSITNPQHSLAFEITNNTLTSNNTTILGTIHQIAGEGGGTYPNGRRAYNNTDYYLNPSSNYTLRVYFYNVGNSVLEFDDLVLAFDYCVGDIDGDGVFNSSDLDSDNDGCPDANEYYNSITAIGTDGNNYFGTGNPPAINTNGTVVGATYTGNITNSQTAVSATVTTEPINKIISTGGSTTFSVLANAQSTTTFTTGIPNYSVPPASDVSPLLTYQWQVSTNGGATWSNVTNGGIYSGATTATLNLTGATVSMDGYLYKAVLAHPNNVCLSVNSNSALLDILPIATNDSACYVISTTAYPAINILTNDTTGDAVVANSFSLIAPGTAISIITDVQGDIVSFVIPGEGTWAINGLDQVVFTPSSGFTGSPTPIQYTGKDAQGNLSNAATITLTTVSAGILSGTQTICSNGTTTFTSSVASGSWTSSDINVATIDANTGVITPVAAGTATMTYTIPASGICPSVSATRDLTVTLAPTEPIIAVTAATCNAVGTATITNFNSAYTYTFTPTGPIAGSGVITGMIPGTSYSLIATNTSGCISSTSSSFSIDNIIVTADTDSDGIDNFCDYDDDNDGILDLEECSSGYIGQNETGAWKGTTNSIFTVTTADIMAINPAATFTLLGNGQYPLNIDPTLGAPRRFSSTGDGEYIVTWSPAVPASEIAFAMTDFDPSSGSTGFTGIIEVNGGLANNLFNAVSFPSRPSVNYNAQTGAFSDNGGLDNQAFGIIGTSSTLVSTLRVKTTGIGVDNLGWSFYASVSCDFDGDGIPNSLDLDSDNDGCSDANEYYNSTTADGGDGGVYGIGAPAVAINGKVVAASYIGSYTNVENATNATITTQPVQQSTTVGGNATFTVIATAQNTITFVAGTPDYTVPPATDSSLNITYQWQVSTNNGATWSNITNGGVYSGATSSTLTITGATLAMNDYDYQVIVKHNENVCILLESDPANLCVINTPIISTTAATCTAAGTATITNFDPSYSYTFAPAGPAATTGGVITGMTPGIDYTLTATNGSGCTSVATAAFQIGTQLVTPVTPTISVTAATCSAVGTATITNVVSGNTYTFAPVGPTVDTTTGVISGITAGTTYVVTTNNGSCTSASSASFSIQPMLTTPVVPAITVAAATCTAAGTATITNFDPSYSYTFAPAGPSAGTGVITGMTPGVAYTLTATNASGCTSTATAAFQIGAQLVTPATPTISVTAATCSAAGVATITNVVSGNTYTFAPVGPTVDTTTGVISGMTAGTTYVVTTNNGSCTSASSASFSIQPMLTTPVVPTISTTAATCTAAGTATITNFDPSYSYTFAPAGPSAGTGVITGMTPGVDYTLTATNASGCTSTATVAFQIGAQLVTPATPTISVTAATCSAAGVATITNVVSGNTYTFAPVGPTVDTTTGVISGMTAGTTYVVTTNNGSCTSTASLSFSVQSQLATPVVPAITVAAATCTAAGTATITNFDPSYSYTFTPAGPSAGTGVITGMTPGVDYTLTATNASGCTSTATVAFQIGAQLVTPATPAISVTAATCSAAGVATITNVVSGNTYTFAPVGPTVDTTTGVISGMTAGTTYVVTTNNGSCTSTASLSFSVQAQLATPVVPAITVAAATCTAAGTATITNFDPSYSYTFAPAGPAATTGGVITGMTPGVDYTLTATNAAGCTSTATVAFQIGAQLVTPDTPTISVTAATCTAVGTATITNVVSGNTYTFAPVGPTVDTTTGVISGMTAGEVYTVTTNNGSCTSASSASFGIQPMLTTPVVPTISTTAATCTAAGTATITNFDPSYSYTFTPAGPSAGTGVITGMTPGVDYTLTATNASGCTSTATVAFQIGAQLVTPATPAISVTAATCSAAGVATITNVVSGNTYTFAPVGPTVDTTTGVISGMTAGTTYVVTTNNGSCTSTASLSFSVQAQLATPVVPAITVAAATCTAAGTATITNFDPSYSYTFAPAGPAATTGGVITGMTPGVDYTLTATNAAGCTSTATVAFQIGAQLVTPDTPTISVTAATCTAVGTATITNVVSGNTYTFAPVGPTVDTTTGVISGMTAGEVYTVTTNNGSCTSASSASFGIQPMLTTPVVPTISTTAATCTAAGTATITNFDPSYSYTFAPAGPAATTGGVITGMTPGVDYTLTATNAAGCTSTATAAFQIGAQLVTPATPTISVTAATCTAVGTATITNVVSGNTYTFAPVGPTVDTTTGVISGMTAGTTYVVTTNNGSCTSTASLSFSVQAQLATPVVPAITVAAATCTAAGTATITNFDPSYSYTFVPAGPSAGTGVITGMTPGVAYTLTATNGSGCTSVATAAFQIGAQLVTPDTPTISVTAATCTAVGTATITNVVSGNTYTFAPVGPTVDTTTGVISGMTAGEVYTVTTNNGSCTSASSASFGIQPMLTTPVVPTISTTAATCTAAGTATITNFDPSYSYTFAPAGPSAGTGVITGMTPGIDYTLTATNASGCTSTATAAFQIGAQLVTPATPTISVTAATCSAAGVATITNVVSGNTYTFAPVGPTVDTTTGVISGMTAGEVYTVTTNNGSCTSTASLSFSVQAQLATPVVPAITVAAATCTAAGTATITNFDPSYSYTFAPAGPAATTGGVITGMTPGVDYTLTATNASGCTSTATVAFQIGAQLVTPATPTISTTAATCSAVGTATITNVVSGNTYTFAPVGPTVDTTTGVISGITAGTTYVVTTNNGSCTSASSASFSIQPMLTTPVVPAITVVAATCTAAGTATITNFDPSYSYTFAPAGPSAGTGVITGMTPGVDYTLTATNASGCTSTATVAFQIGAQLVTPATPTISVTAATCSAAGVATITNVVSGNTYTFAPVGPTVDTTTGVISNLVAGTSYTVTTNNGSCTSASSASFSIQPMLTTPVVPAITVAAATCTAAGTATITNFDPSYSYTFAPAGPSAGTGVITGMTPGVDYTLTATNASGCTSTATVAFQIGAQLVTPATPAISTTAATCSAAGVATITNVVSGNTYTFAPVGPTVDTTTGVISGMTAGEVYTVTTNNGSCTSTASLSFSVQAQLATPVVPAITVAAATCTAAGTATITNFDPSYSYTFAPAGPAATTGGVITGMTPGVDYTLTATNGSGCTSVAMVAFQIGAQLVTPATPTISVTAATCSAAGVATITNVVSGNTYTFTPADPSIAVDTVTGVISGMTAGTTYVVTTNNGSCTSASSASFSIQPMLTTPVVPAITVAAATCTAAGTATITNFDPSYSYTFAPAGPSAGTGVITGMTPGVAYTLTATNGSGCTSVATAAFQIGAQLVTPDTPTISNTPATCSSANIVKVTNLVSGVNYVVSRTGPTVDLTTGVISGMTAGETYTVKAVSTSGSCSSAASVTFSLQPQFGTPAAPVSGGNQSVCIPTGSSATLTAVASSQAGTTITWYENSNGTGITSPTYTSSTAYTRTIYAQAVSSQGCASALTAVTQTFYDAPVITNYTTNDPICEVNTKTLYATTPGGVWTVQSGGGTISAASSPNVFTYTPANVTTPTSVTVRYTLTPVAPSVCPPATHDVTFTVNPNPDAPTVGSVIHPTCINANGSFKIANYLATNTYTITSTDGDVISGPTATGTVTATAGTYTISVSNTYGCTGSASIDVTLNPQPATPLTPTISNTPATCSSANIVKVTNLVSGVNYVVSPTGPTVDLTTGVISGMIAGETYTVKAVSIPGGCSSAASTSFSLQAQLVTPAAPTSGGDQVSCSPASLTATASAEAGATITWYADATSTTPVTPTLSTVGMVTYYAEATLGACKSATRTAVTLTINQTPTAPTSGGNITECAASPIQTLTATATSPGNTVVWYTQATGGTALATAPTLNAVGTVTYYAEAVTSANCSSTTRTPVTLTINATPAAPTSGGDQVSCSPASLTASASAEAGATITWYADATSTTPVTPTLSTVGMVTYYAEATLGTCKSATRTPVTLTINQTPDTPTISNTPATCSSANIVKVTNLVSGVNYVVSPTGPTVDVTTGVISGMIAGETYNVKAVSTPGGCSSAASTSFSLQAPLVTPAAPTSGGDQVSCSPASLTATASAEAGATITWYADATSTTPVTPTLSTVGTVTYYAEATLGACKSATRTLVTLTINQTPEAPTSGGDITECATSPIQTLTAIATSTGNTVTWYTQATGGTIVTSPTLNTVGTVTYYAEAVTSANCSSTTRTPVTLTIKATPAVPTLVEIIQPSCTSANGSFKIGNYLATNTYSITSADGSVISGPTATGLVTAAAGTYSIKSILNGCESTPVTVTINPQECADIVTVKTDGQTMYVAGSTVTYTITVTNNGPTAATNVTVADTAPAGTTISSWTGSNGSSGTGDVNNVLPTLAVGQTVTYTVNVAVPATMTGNLTNTVTVTSVTPDPNPACTTCTDTDTPNTTFAENDINNTYADTPVSGNVKTNDSDAEGHGQMVTPSITVTPEGTLFLNANGTYNFIPAAGFTGTFVHTYTICDNATPQACDTATLTIEVMPDPSDPTSPNDVVANNDTATTPEGQPVTIDVKANDFDPNGDAFEIDPTSITQPANGTVTVNPDGTITYTPNPGFEGTDTFTYTVCDDATPTPACDTATVSVNVVPANNTNETYANDDAYNGDQYQPITGNVLDNDTDPDVTGNDQFVTGYTQPAHGTVTIDPITGEFTYTPTDEYTGPLSFTYTICDNGTPQACDIATVYLTINPANETLAVNDINNTYENTPVSGSVSTNDSDPQGHTQTVTPSTTTTAEGTLVLNANGTYTFTPAAGFTGTFVHTYTVCDSGTPQACDTATLTIEVMPDPSDPTSPNDVVANNDTATTPEGQPVTIDVKANDFDPNGDAFEIDPTSITQPANGTVTVNPDGTITYTPNPGFEGTDTFTYTVCDDATPTPACDTATVSVNVVPANNTNETYANDDAYNGDQYQPITGSVLDNDTDPDDNATGNIQTVKSNTQPAHGSVQMNPDGTFTYTPTPGDEYTGPLSFTYEVCDNGNPQACDIATVYLTINPANETLAVNDINNTYENTPVSGSVSTNDSDPQGHTQTVTPSTTTTAEGTLVLNANGTYTFTPAAGFTGTFVHTYTVCDSGTPQACDTATLTIEVMPDPSDPTSPNDVVANNDTATTPEGQPVTIDVKANDFDPNGDAFEIDPTSITQPANGTVTVNPDGTITYTPNPGFEGTDTFTYTVCDDATPTPACDTATVSVNVVPANNTNETYANDDAYNGDQYQPITGSVLDNDTDPDDNATGNIQTVKSNTQPAHGSVQMNPDGTFTYTPTPGDEYTGPLSFTYEVCDNGNPQACDTATVYLTINPANETLAVNDINNTYVNTPVSGSVSTNDSDPQGHTQTVTPSTTTTAEGTLVLNANGTYTFTPAAGFTGTFVHTYTVCDSGTPQACDTATLTIEVMPNPFTGPNDVVANNDTATTEEGQPVTINVKANDFDPNGDTVGTPTVVTQPANGTVTVNPDGTITYTPNPGFEGTDTFTYTVCDDATPTPACDTATVSVNVVPTPEPGENVIYANDDAYNGDGPTIEGSVFDNDSDPDSDTSTIHTFTVVDQPKHGMVTIDPITGEFIYTPEPGYVGPDSFRYTVCDDGDPQACDTATVYLSVNSAPSLEITKAGSYVDTNEDGIANAGDEIHYVFTVKNTGNVVLTNVTVSDDNAVVSGGPLASLAIGATDSTTFTAVHVLTATDLAAGYVYNLATAKGTDPTGAEVTDASVDPNPCSTCPVEPTCVDCTIVAIPNTTHAIDDINNTFVNTPVSGNVLTNDFDREGHTQSIDLTSVTQPANGTVQMNADGSYTYTPNAGFTGVDTFTYTICDNGTPQACETATVTINVEGLIDPNVNVVVANNDAVITKVDTPIAIVVLANDFDPQGDSFSVQKGSLTKPSHGKVTLNADGTVTYTPDPGYVGEDSFMYTICDNGTPQACEEATVIVTILPASNLNSTYAVDDSYYINCSSLSDMNLLDNDYDLEKDGQYIDIKINPVIGPKHGTLELHEDGTFTYTVNGCYVGPDSFVYEVRDTNGDQAIDRATVYLMIQDTTAPEFVEALPSDVTVECNAVPAAPVLTAVDTCGSAEVSYKEARIDGACANSYTLERTWTATDACGNTTVHTQIVTVEDTTGPSFVGTMPAAEIYIRCEELAAAETLQAQDECGEVEVRSYDEKVEGDCESKYDIIRTWVATDSCGNETRYTQTIHLSCPMEIFNAVTPNGDGMNDEFVLKGINCYPGNTVEIYNRWGVLVYETRDYNSRGNTFKGYSEGRVTVKQHSKLPTGTYYYVVKYTYDLGDGRQYPTEQAGYLHLETN